MGILIFENSLKRNLRNFTRFYKPAWIKIGRIKRVLSGSPRNLALLRWRYLRSFRLSSARRTCTPPRNQISFLSSFI